MINIEKSGLILNVKIYHQLQEKNKPKDVMIPDAQIVSEQHEINQNFSAKESSKHGMTDPRVKYDTVVRSYTENRLEKDVQSC